MQQVKAVVMDIMGTTTHMEFFYKLVEDYRANGLFYLRNAAAAYGKVFLGVKSRNNLKRLEDVVEFVSAELMARHTQPDYMLLLGKVNTNGFMMARLKGKFYQDIRPALRDWHELDLKLYTFSMGIAEGQELMFKTANLDRYMDGYFDAMKIGGKDDPRSYRKISRKIMCEPSLALFLSDTVKELDAAKEASLNVILVDRDNKLQSAEAGHRVVSDFSEIEIVRRTYLLH